MFFNNNSSGQFSSFNEKRIYNIFNAILVLTILVMFCISLFLLYISAYSSFSISIGNIFLYLILMRLHIKGHYLVSRYSYFLFTILAEIYGSLYHGENGGFDFYFLVTALIPVFFFQKRIYYTSLFIIGLAGYVLVKYLYAEVAPVMPFPEKEIVPYYANLVIAVGLMYIVYELFKFEHLKYEQELNRQNEEIQNQKEKLSVLKDQLEAHLATKTKVVELQDENIKKYAFLNAHKARGPLARILGLINLTHFEDLSKEETRGFYLKELQLNAKEMDDVLTEINEILTIDLEK